MIFDGLTLEAVQVRREMIRAAAQARAERLAREAKQEREAVRATLGAGLCDRAHYGARWPSW